MAFVYHRYRVYHKKLMSHKLKSWEKDFYYSYRRLDPSTLKGLHYFIADLLKTSAADCSIILRKRMRKIQSMITSRMNKYVNTPSSERKNAFDELAELDDELDGLLIPR